MASVIGIDLGTTNSVLAYLDESGDPKVHTDSLDGTSIVPSAVRIDGGKVTVGGEAMRLKVQGLNVWTRFKRDIGSGKIYETNETMDITPESLSTFVLKKLVADFTGSNGDEIKSAIITYPANFQDDRREATLSAGKLAELPIETGINEPTAAALYFAIDGNLPAGKYAVYDFGGGTWDISVIEINNATASEGGVDVLVHDGIAECGGSDFDDALQNLVESKYREQSDVEIDRTIPIYWEELKKGLSVSTERLQVVRGVDGIPVNIDVTRDEFEKAISPLLAMTEMSCQNIFDNHPDILDVLLVGGSTRVPAVRESVKKVFGKDAVTIGNPDEVVALGAAIYAGLKADHSNLNPAQIQKLSTVKFKEVAAHDFGILSVTRNEHGEYEDKISYLIERGSVIPSSKEKPFYTVFENQSYVDLEVYQSGNAEQNKRFAHLLRQGKMNLPDGLPFNDQIDVTFAFDEGGILHCEFVHTSSGRTEKFSVAPQYEVTDSDREKIDSFKIE